MRNVCQINKKKQYQRKTLIITKVLLCLLEPFKFYYNSGLMFMMLKRNQKQI